MTAAFAMARAALIDEFAVAEFLPAIEEAMVAVVNERRGGDGN